MSCRTRVLPFLATVVVAAACGDAGPGWSGAVDTLESGVVMVTNPVEGLWGPDQGWTVTEELRIGSAMADGPELFGRVSDIAVDAAGRIFVVEGQANEIRVFGPDGAHLRTIGREGAGPGEFRGLLGAVFGPDGALWVADPANARYTIVAPDGEFVGDHLRRLNGSYFPWNAGFGPDGRLYERTSVFGSSRTALMGMDSAFEPVDTVFFPDAGLPEFTLTTENGFTRVRVPFGSLQLDQWDPRGYLWTTLTGTYVITQMDMAGDTLRVIHGPPIQRVPVTSEERAEALERLEPFRSRGGRVDASAIPSEKPPIESLDVSTDGYLWARLTPAPDQEGARYHVFTPDGRFLGEVDAPASFGWNAVIQPDRVTGVVYDSLGVPYVVRWRIDRGAASD